MNALVLAVLGPGLWLACREDAPLPLPPSAQQAPQTLGRRVRKGVVDGYITRPLAAASGPRPGRLLLAPDLSAETLAAADARALQDQAVVLAIPPEVAEDAARAYLGGMPDVAELQRICLRQSCP